MRLEIDTTVPVHPPTAKADLSTQVDSADVRSTLNHGIKAAQAGNRLAARTSLLKVTELDPRNENAWLWLASISEYPEELLGFLNHVLEINPDNQRANEWKTATHALLAKTFVQRGLDASQQDQKDFAAECFHTALEYNVRNADAWMGMASLSDSNVERVSLLEKALSIEPENEDVIAARDAARAGFLKERLAEAKTAAVSGNRAEALNVLESVLAIDPSSIEAWTMKSHLSEGFDEKIRCFENILAIDPDNVAAKAGRDSLLAIFVTPVEVHEGTAYDAIPVTIEPEHEAPEVEMHFSAAEWVEEPSTEDSEIYVEAAEPVEHYYEEETEKVPEEVYENDQPEIVAEPFATYAEETPNTNEAAAVSSDEITPVTESIDLDAEESGAQVYEHEAPHADAQVETVAFRYETISDSEPPHVSYETEDTDEWSNLNSAPAITIPEEALPAVEAPDSSNAFETTVEVAEVLPVRPEHIECPFCRESNDAQVISCQSCRAVLTLSDLELLLGDQNSDTLILRQSVEEMERRRLSTEFSTEELVTLGLGHLNLRNLQTGYSCLLEASRQSPNNVVLAGQVNSLLIRLEEIKQQEAAHLKMPKGKSILVVDDSPTVRKLISGKLEKSGHQVVCANDGVEAMERLQNFVPDLVLLDITMPRMDGYQVCKQIRSNAATKDVTVVMISGKDGFFDKVRGRMAGTTGYITKPFGPETLMKAVEMYLSGEAPDLNEP